MWFPRGLDDNSGKYNRGGIFTDQLIDSGYTFIILIITTNLGLDQRFFKQWVVDE